MEENILFIRGDIELGKAIGISNKHELNRLRKEGLPHYKIGKSFIYEPEEVKKWIKRYGKVQRNSGNGATDNQMAAHK